MFLVFHYKLLLLYNSMALLSYIITTLFNYTTSSYSTLSSALHVRQKNPLGDTISCNLQAGTEEGVRFYQINVQ